MDLRVTTVSKKEQRLSRTAAAVFVISREDIRRSGATSIPDLLRMVPGVDVAQLNANAWAISIRGFNSQYSNKVLVMVDGRAVYTPAFSGVYWDHEDMPLEDIERIEVIRGPGGAVWGANAVNGVISIITKSAADTQGGLMKFSAGSDQRASATLRYGGKHGNLAYRVSTKYLNADSRKLENGRDGGDQWQRGQSAFRLDWTKHEGDSVLVEGSAFANSEGTTRYNVLTIVPWAQVYMQRFSASGGNALARWNHTFKGGSEATLQVYFNGYARHEFETVESLAVGDFDFQHHVQAGGRHDIVWGLAYRATRSRMGPGPAVSFNPTHDSSSLHSTFVQDEFRLSNSLWLAAGSKFEHNAYTGFEYEPSLRLTWLPKESHTAWFALSRAIRQPSRLDTAADMNYPGGSSDPNVRVLLSLRGNANMRSEKVREAEAGYRAQLSPRLSLDFAAFYSSYRDLVTLEPLTPPAPATSPLPIVVFLPYQYRNGGSATSYGSELSLSWTPRPWWQVTAGHSYLNLATELEPWSEDTMLRYMAKFDRKHGWTLRSLLNLTGRVDLDCSLYGASRREIGAPAYNRVDTRLAWRPNERVEFSVVGQNLLRPSHLESGLVYAMANSGIPRSVHGSVTWRF